MPMKIAATAAIHASGDDPIVFRGPFEQTLPQIAQLGYQWVELHLYDSDALDRPALWQLLKDCRLGLTSIGTGSAYERDGICLGSGDVMKRQAAVRRLEGHMKTAAPCGAVVIIGLIAGRVADDCLGRRDLFIQNLVAGLKECCELAEKYEVQLVFEVMNRFESDYATNINEALKLLELVGSDRLSLHLDTVHLNIEEDHIYEAILSAAGKVGHMHVADNNRYYPGHAHYNFNETLTALREIGYEGALALETHNLPSTEISARKSIEYLSHLLRQVNGEYVDQ